MRAMTVVSSPNVQLDTIITRNLMNEMKIETTGAQADQVLNIGLKNHLETVSSESDKDSVVYRGQLNNIQSVNTTLIGQYDITYYGHCKYK